MSPSTLTFNTSVKGEETCPIRIQKWSEAVPDGMTTSCPRLAVSAAEMPPNHAQISPVRGGASPLPEPQLPKSHNGVPKLVEVCGSFQIMLGMPPFSNPPSAMMFAGVHDGDAVAVFVGVAVSVICG